ncbi:MAG TPA: glycosyltransferase family 1 protein [Candidatus Latescibacteria bacterium]|nr:glycosyltransferase family 1 protein [Candidatus Handelsmanbacteria bacterium]HIL09077.1 glycosyltransferase family 1 protein [Candidatus Latescibacterota bacterium]
MRLAYITAGAAGMYCGTCIHDNTLATALKRRGIDVALIPTYTPLRTDEEDVSLDRVFYGGINVFLQQKWSFFRHTPRTLDRLLDSPRLLNSLARFSASTSAQDLGSLTVSVLKGEQGHQQKELSRLVSWLRDDFKPDIVQLTNAMFAGMGRQLKDELGVPVLCGLQGEDIFLEQLIEPYRTQAQDTLRQRAPDIDAFIAPCTYYRDYMAEYMQVADEKIHVVPLGLNLAEHGVTTPATGGNTKKIGYLARICPEKGFHLLVDAFRLLKERTDLGPLRLETAGYLGPRDKAYFQEQIKKIAECGLEDSFTYHGEVDRQEKIKFLSGLHVFSMPTTYAEPKGLSILESLANGTPVVQPDHGTFPEMLATTGGGLLFEPHSAEDLADNIARLLRDERLRQQLGQTGRKAVHSDFHDDATATKTLAVYKQYAGAS